MAFISSPLLPLARRGTQFNGLAHLADIYLTVAVGIAKLSIDVSKTGPIPPDSFNLWPALMGGSPSPRPEVVHLPLSEGNPYGVNTTMCRKAPGHGCAPSIRKGQWKLIVGWPGEDQLVKLPPENDSFVPYGIDGGIVRNQDQAIGPHWKQGGPSQNSRCEPACLFDLSVDKSESHDLYATHSDIAQQLMARLLEVSKTGSPYNDFPYPQSWTEPMMCAIKNVTSTWLPADYDGRTLPPPPPPLPPPGSCAKELKVACPHNGSDFEECLLCTREAEAAGKARCKPKERSAYCNSTSPSPPVPPMPTPSPPAPPSPSPAPQPHPSGGECDSALGKICDRHKHPSESACLKCTREAESGSSPPPCSPEQRHKYCDNTGTQYA